MQFLGNSKISLSSVLVMMMVTSECPTLVGQWKMDQMFIKCYRQNQIVPTVCCYVKQTYLLQNFNNFVNISDLNFIQTTEAQFSGCARQLGLNIDFTKTRASFVTKCNSDLAAPPRIQHRLFV